MQRGLVNHRAMDEGGAGALVREAQPVEAGNPAAIEAPFEADLLASSFVSWHAPKVEADVMSQPHHM